MTALVDATAGIMCFTTPNNMQFVELVMSFSFPILPTLSHHIVHIKLLSREKLGCLQKLIYLG